MRSLEYICLFTVLVILLACTSGCTTTQNTGPRAAPVTTSAAETEPSFGSPGVQITPTSQAVQTNGIDTTINIHYNDYDCLDVTKELGVVYLNPDQKYSIFVSPGNNQVNVNVLLLDVGDKERIQNAMPVWNAVSKTWDYESIVPLVQFNDVSTAQEKTVTIKDQGKYYLCADDRKESGVNDVIIKVPVKMTRIA
ncbi:MAG: hypothetical protein ABSE07_04135 [Methanoregula sp.]|jgi:hypothetical protein